MRTPAVVLFDVFGTLVDWRTSVTVELAAFLEASNQAHDPASLADDWRARYQPAMEEIRSGRRPWTTLDVLHRQTLLAMFADRGVPQPDDAVIDQLALAWHRLEPWPDVAEGLRRLRAGGRTVGTLSNGNTALLDDLARHGDLTFDHLLGAETARAYKPLPEAYLRNVATLGLQPSQVMLVAAHNADLHAAAAVGLRTGFLPRPTEHGPGQTSDLEPTGDWDVVADDVLGLADRLGC